MKDLIQDALQWYVSTRPKFGQSLCESRDIFQVRLDHFYQTLHPQWNDESGAALLTAVIGEIGNNCFDHNLGQWRDIAGCWFHFQAKPEQINIVISDRGQGVFSSLKQVLPNLRNDQEALEIAFKKQISGRSPEKRGNGLKFVRSIINNHIKRGLLFLSGTGSVSFGGLQQEISRPIKEIPKRSGGTLAIILWRKNDEN